MTSSAPGGKTINEIIAQCQVEIDVEDDGQIFITGERRRTQESRRLDQATHREIAVGEVFTGKVTRLMEFGAFVEIAPKQEGLVHVSELAQRASRRWATW